MEPRPLHETLQAALAQALPTELHHLIPTLLPTLAEAVEGTVSPAEAGDRLRADPALAAAIDTFTGRKLVLGGALVSFGERSQFGDVSIGPVAGRDLFQIQVRVTQSAPAGPATRPQNRQRHVMLERVRMRWMG